MRGPVSFQLENRQHIHVVDPVACLRREPIGLRILPLTVRPCLPVNQKSSIVGLKTDLERYDTENGIVHMMPDRYSARFCPTRHQRLELLDQLRAQSIVVSQLSERQGTIPGRGF